MNNIYKVIWSKAKNCYVVASEIARSHTKSATGSEKIGGVTRRSLLASLMALSLLCGGLGVASAANGTVHVAESAAGTAEVYTTEKVDTLLKDYGKKTDVEDNKNNIAALRTTTMDQGQKITENATQIANNTDAIDKKIDTETANEKFAAKVDLTALQNQVTGKVDENTFEDALEDKADRTYVDTEVGKKADKTYVDTEVGRKANKETTLTGYGITDAYTKDATDTAITTKVNEEKDARELKDTELSGRIDTLSTTVNSKVSKTDLNTTLGNYYTQAETNAAIKTAVDDEKNARENAINGEVTSRNKAIADAIALEETNRDAAITKEETKRKEEDAKLEGKITENTTAINNEKAVREAADTDLSKRIGTVTEDGKYIKKSGTNNVSENLKVLDTQAKINADNIQTNANNIKTNKDEIARVNGELVKTNDYFNKELGKTNEYFNKELGKTNDHFNTELGNTNAALQATNKRTAGIERTGTGVAADNQTVIEGNVRFDQNGNVSGVKDLQTDTIHATGEITSGGLDAKAGDIKTTGKVSAGDISTGTLETTGNATIGGNLDVTGTLNIKDVTAETINISKSENNPDYKSEGSIIGEGGKLSVSNEKFDKRNNITEKSELNVNEKGTVNWATSTDATGNVTEGRSEVTADNIKNSVKKTEGGKTFGYEENITETGKVGTATDKEGNTSSTRQDSKGVYGYAKDQDGNKSYTKQEGNRIAESVIGQDGKQTKSEMTSTDITNTAKDGTITNDAKDIVNKASGNISNSSATMDTTVTGKATESYGELETEVKGNEKHTVKGDQINEVDGKQINTIKNGQENIISGGQINNITGDQTTTVTGDISNTAKNITNEANTKLTDKVGTNTRVLDSEGITDTVPGADGKGSTFKQRIDAIMGNVKTDAGESEVTQKGDEITSKVGLGEATNSRVTQKKDLLEAAVTDGTNYNISNDTANASAKVLTDGTKVNKLQDNLNSSEKTITNGTYTTSKLQTALDITNTAKDGTITNDAKNIVNNATGDMTNTVGGKLTTTVTGQATENFKGGLKTDITGEEIHTVTGNQTNKVTGKQTNTVEGGQENIISGGQINNITGDQTTTISGTQTTTATDINRNASSSMVDKVDNAYGTNTETKVAGKTTTDVSIKGTGEKGQYIRGANESRDYLIKGTLKNSETKTAEATSTEITDGNGKTSSTIQDVTQISGSVTDGTNTSVSNVKANSIDSAVTDGSSISTINQKKNSITSQVTDGTTITKTEQDTKNITNTAKDGTITNDAKDIVNNASGNMTNTVGGDLTTTVSGNELHEVTGKQTNKIDGDQENTIGGNQTTTVTGDISNKAENITNEANTKLTDKVGENTRVLDSEGITDTVGGSTFKQRIDKIMMESKDVSIKAEETLTNEAKVITNKASEVINNEAVNINNTATGIITSKASEIKNQADKLISNKVGENTWENMENGKITTSIKDGAKQNLTQSDAAGTTQSTVDGGKSTVTIQNADGLADAVTDGTNTSVQNQTASAIAAAVKDGAGNENASVANATTSVNTIKSGSKANTVISTADGTRFINSEAAAPVTGASGAGTHLNTTIKGNTITTGKVTMDYAEVMKDLGVRGNANITGKTTTGSLEVKGESKLTGDVTMESNATVKKDLTVEGNTNLKNTKVDGTLDVTQKANFGDSVSIAKDLSVDGNATIKGDVTAKSYKVGDKTYIDKNGIHANGQKITDVADGSISEGSKDAVNGGQLYTVKNDLEGKVNKVGANAAAMANLHPMEFDPDSKWNIAAAIGNYGSETAAALGAFYRPNDDVMVNLSTAFGTGENMVGGGVSVRLGKGGNKLSREETNALKAQVADLTARMDALLSVLNPNMSKDFPDVPENHWAYEAVSRLAGNDIVQGYPDGEFHGERTMTRYEMAEIIYNALSRGAEAEKELVEEFKPELQAMAASEKATAEKAEG